MFEYKVISVKTSYLVIGLVQKSWKKQLIHSATKVGN